MRLPIRCIAAVLLSFLLLLQMGGAVAAGFTAAPAIDCQDHAAAAPLHAASHAGAHQGTTGSAASDCATHCALAPVSTITKATALRPTFLSYPQLVLRRVPAEADRIERPPKLLSC